MKYATLALLILLTGLTATSAYKAHGIETLLHTREVQEMSAEYVTTWTSEDGEHEVRTTQGNEETPAEHAQRHKDAVDALQAKFPKI